MAISTVDGSHYPARIGSGEASQGCHSAAQVSRCSCHSLPARCRTGSERQLQRWRALKFLVPLISPTTHAHTYTITSSLPKSLYRRRDLLSETISTPVLPISYQMYYPEMGRNPRHDNVPEGYCFPLAPVLQLVEMSPILLTMPPDSSCSCYRMARRRSLRPRSLVSQVPVGDAKVVLLDSTRRRLTGEFQGMSNCSDFTLKKEDHTLGNLVSEHLKKHPNVLMAGYKSESPSPLRGTEVEWPGVGTCWLTCLRFQNSTSP